jgi:patatin-like phospholipase/acyl hydrolase
VSDKVFKILSVDGGGIKGLYSSSIIEQFEEKYFE